MAKTHTSNGLLALFGGAMDSTFEPVKSTFDAIKKLSFFVNGIGPTYFEWTSTAFFNSQARDHVQAFANNTPNAPIVLVGHSYGGESAMRVAMNTSTTIDLLVTIDAVSWQSKLFWDDKPGQVRNWLNIHIEGYENYTDVVAVVGGYWGEKSGATNIKAKPGTSHADFSTMLQQVWPQITNVLSFPRKGV